MFSKAFDADIDISHLLDQECFLCGHEVKNASNFGKWGPAGDFSVLLPCHMTCLHGRSSQEVAREYHRRISDLAGVERMH